MNINMTGSSSYFRYLSNKSEKMIKIQTHQCKFCIFKIVNTFLDCKEFHCVNYKDKDKYSDLICDAKKV